MAAGLFPRLSSKFSSESRNCLKIISIVSVLLLLESCAWRFNRFERVHLYSGMEEWQVLNTVGEPENTFSYGRFVAWVYCAHPRDRVQATRTIWIKDGTVFDKPTLAENATAALCAPDAIRVSRRDSTRIASKHDYRDGSPPPSTAVKFYDRKSEIIRYKDNFANSASLRNRSDAIKDLKENGTSCFDAEEVILEKGGEKSIDFHTRGSGKYMVTCVGSCDELSYQYTTSYVMGVDFYPVLAGFPAFMVSDPTLFTRHDTIAVRRAPVSSRDGMARIKVYVLRFRGGDQYAPACNE